MQVRLLPGAQYFIQRQFPVIELPVMVGAQHQHVRRVVDLGECRVSRPRAECLHVRELDVDVIAAVLAYAGSVAIRTATVISDLAPAPRRVNALGIDRLGQLTECRVSPDGVSCLSACVACRSPARPHEVCCTTLLAHQRFCRHSLRGRLVARCYSAAPCAVLCVRRLYPTPGTFSFYHDRIYDIACSIVKSCNPVRTRGTV